MKSMAIEDLLRWAYRTELPKAERGAVGFHPAGFSASSWSDGMAAVDNGFGVVIDWQANGPPHPDALVIGRAVAALDAYAVAVPEDWNPVADLGLSEDETRTALATGLRDVFVTDAQGETRPRRALSVLLRHHAIMGGGPDWEAEVPERRIITGPNGRPRWFRMVDVDYGTVDGQRMIRSIEQDGYDAKRHRPHPDAYRKTLLDPDPALAVAWRAEYELWVMGLAALVDVLEGPRSRGGAEMAAAYLDGSVLHEHRAEPSARPIRPWESGDVAAPVVCRDLSTGSGDPWQSGKVIRFQPVSERPSERIQVLKVAASGRRRRRS
jgi:hypothetical protein